MNSSSKHHECNKPAENKVETPATEHPKALEMTTRTREIAKNLRENNNFHASNAMKMHPGFSKVVFFPENFCCHCWGIAPQDAYADTQIGLKL